MLEIVIFRFTSLHSFSFANRNFSFRTTSACFGHQRYTELSLNCEIQTKCMGLGTLQCSSGPVYWTKCARIWCTHNLTQSTAMAMAKKGVKSDGARVCISREIETRSKWTWKNYKFSEIIKLFKRIRFVPLYGLAQRREKSHSPPRTLFGDGADVVRYALGAHRKIRFPKKMAFCHRSKMCWTEKWNLKMSRIAKLMCECVCVCLAWSGSPFCWGATDDYVVGVGRSAAVPLCRCNATVIYYKIYDFRSPWNDKLLRAFVST